MNRYKNIFRDALKPPLTPPPPAGDKCKTLFVVEGFP